MSDSVLQEEKTRLRRSAMKLPAVDGSRLIERFLVLPQVKQAKTLFLFFGVGKEPDTRPLIEHLLKQGKRVALPVCLPGGILQPQEIQSLGEVSPGRFGIPAPVPGGPVISKAEIDLVLVPNLLCDRDGYRLGYGGGYYDRWLADYNGVTVALCPKERMTEKLPRETFDIPVQIVISEE